MNPIFTQESKMNDATEMYYHEAQILKFYMLGNDIILDLENVAVGEEIRNVGLLFKNIKKFQTDAEIVNSNLMYSSFGEILDMIMNGHKAKIIVLWHKFSPHVCYTKVYDIEFDEIVNNIK